MRRAISWVFVAGMLAACHSAGGGNEPMATYAGLDVSGASNAPCTLTVVDEGKTMTFAIAAPNPAVTESPADTRAPLAPFCDTSDAAAVDVTTTAGSCVRASRTSTELCFVQDGCLSSPQTSKVDCPVTLTLTCNGQTLYDHVAWNLCAWLG